MNIVAIWSLVCCLGLFACVIYLAVRLRDEKQEGVALPKLVNRLTNDCWEAEAELVEAHEELNVYREEERVRNGL